MVAAGTARESVSASARFGQLHSSREVPLFEHKTWDDFVPLIPREATLVAIETGGTPLDEFEHPRCAVCHLAGHTRPLPRARGCMGGVPRASQLVLVRGARQVYLLGSEDKGLPKSVREACREVVSLRSERHASYNVSVAGALVLYDRQARWRERSRREADARPGALTDPHGYNAGEDMIDPQGR